MGQYYKFVNIDKKEICDRNRHGYKLMEHSYVSNDYCNDILRLLSNEWKGDRVIHVGDYAESTDSSNTANIIEKLSKELGINHTIYSYAEGFKNVTSKSNSNIRYVYNLDKKEYVDLFKQPIQNFWIDKNTKKISACKINSFALLTGCGNEQGGGDYYFQNKKFVGSWAGDRFISSLVPLDEYKNYKYNNLVFNENTKHYKKIKKYYNFLENKILKDESLILNDFLEYLRKSNYDYSKYKIDDSDLLDNEIKLFNDSLNKSQELLKVKKEKEVNEEYDIR